LARFTICAKVEIPQERQSLQVWLEKWKTKVDFVSENIGCGCCVDLYDVDGSEEAMAEVPKQMLTSSPWTRGEQA
jgi:hypothetical protein